MGELGSKKRLKIELRFLKDLGGVWGGFGEGFGRVLGGFWEGLGAFWALWGPPKAFFCCFGPFLGCLDIFSMLLANFWLFLLFLVTLGCCGMFLLSVACWAWFFCVLLLRGASEASEQSERAKLSLRGVRASFAYCFQTNFQSKCFF